MSEKYIFHGGCIGCTQQELLGVDNCIKCQYFDADWKLPNLNNELPNTAEMKKKEIKRRLEQVEPLERWINIHPNGQQFVFSNYPVARAGNGDDVKTIHMREVTD